MVNNETKKEDKVYMHIGNGGFTFEVIDNDGPMIVIEQNQFGHTTEMKILTDKESLEALSLLFEKASKKEYKGEYCTKASVTK